MAYKWNDDWRDELKKDDEECYIRLCDVHSVPKDILKIAKLMYKYNPSQSKENCLDRTLEWITDWNNQVYLYPDDDTYQKYLESI